MAEECDKEFLKKHDEDLNTTLIFVSSCGFFNERALTWAQAGLFSAVASAFIIQSLSQLQPDPIDETSALLRVLIYKIDNTTFGDNVPALPQWTGPPRAIVQVQAILFSSLAISLFSALLAMLGKQWLNRYESTDMRGSAIERSHNRQQKQDGVVAWGFERVMESLPLMLQAALLLLGCALSRYLWEIDITVASVVLGMTSFGVIFYLLIVVAGTVSESCPYQTPGAHIFRLILQSFRHHLLPTLHSTSAAIYVTISSNFSRLFEASWCCRLFFDWWSAMKRPWYENNITSILMTPVSLFVALGHDAYYLVHTIFQLLAALYRTAHHQLMGSHRTAYRWFLEISSLRTIGQDQRTIMLDLTCISWILQTSLDIAVRLSTFKYLTSLPELAPFHPSLVVDCFNIFTRCLNVSDGKVVILQGMEQLATMSADGFFRTLYHLTTIDPTSSVLVDLQRRYNEVFPSEIDFTSLPFQLTMTKIHTLAGRFGNPHDIRWHNHGLFIQEHIPFARRMAEAAKEKYNQTQPGKVPRWILRSTLYFLSLGSVSPPSVVADCLTIIAIDLGCDMDIVISDERCVQV